MNISLLLSSLLFGVLFFLPAASQAQWQPDVRLTNDPAFSLTSYNNAWCVAASGNALHVVWRDFRDGNYEIYYKRSIDGGTSWGADTRLTSNSASSEFPSVSVSGSVVHVVWSDERDGNWEIYYKRSTDGGSSWGQDTRLTNNTAGSYYPSVSVSGSVVHVVWLDSRDGNWEIYYKRSTGGGSSWGQDTRLTNSTAFSYYPSVSVSGSVVHVVWQDDRDGNWEIYYKRDPTGNTVGIEIIESEIPGQFRLEQNYPNPFNPSTILRYQLPTRSHVTLKVYDVLGREVATLVDELQDAGSKTIQWNAAGFASGVYLYKLVARDFVETKKLLLLK